MLLLLLLSIRACFSRSASLLLLGALSVSLVDMLLALRLFLRASGDAAERSVIKSFFSSAYTAGSAHLATLRPKRGSVACARTLCSIRGSCADHNLFIEAERALRIIGRGYKGPKFEPDSNKRGTFWPVRIALAGPLCTPALIQMSQEGIECLQAPCRAKDRTDYPGNHQRFTRYDPYYLQRCALRAL